MKRLFLAALLCAATQVSASEPAATPAPNDNAANIAKQAKEQTLQAPEADPADAKNEKRKMPPKDKMPKVKEKKDVPM